MCACGHAGSGGRVKANEGLLAVRCPRLVCLLLLVPFWAPPPSKLTPSAWSWPVSAALYLFMPVPASPCSYSVLYPFLLFSFSVFLVYILLHTLFMHTINGAMIPKIVLCVHFRSTAAVVSMRTLTNGHSAFPRKHTHTQKADQNSHFHLHTS